MTRPEYVQPARQLALERVHVTHYRMTTHVTHKVRNQFKNDLSEITKLFTRSQLDGHQ